MLQPRGGLCVIEADESKDGQTKSGIIIPAKVRDNPDVPKYGTVLALGPGKILDSGVDCPITHLKVGDRVLYQVRNAMRLEGKGGAFDGRDVWILNEQDIIGVEDESLEYPAPAYEAPEPQPTLALPNRQIVH